LVPEPDPNVPNALGLYLLDRWGNRELLYRDPAIGSTSPIPLRPTAMPPVVPSALPKGAADEGRLLLLDVSRGLPDEYRGQVKALRVIQVLPKATPVADGPPVGLAGQEPTRMVLGTVPVEADGSAHFTAPARKPLLFQALDAHGVAIQTMRSATYLQPGEAMSCVGCHEPRTTSPQPLAPLAAGRAPSTIEPGPDGTRPFSFVRLVQPVLDRYCVSCHGDEKPARDLSLTATVVDRWTKSYLSLTGGQTFYGADTNEENAHTALVPRYGGWNPIYSTPPGGVYGARGSRLMQMLLAGHEGVELDADSLERLALWIDANALFYGTYEPAEQAKQLRGEVIAEPELQ
jgi:cytochrome c553